MIIDAMRMVAEHKGCDLLVISEKYPPNAIGGAEQSLHITLSRLAREGKKIVVLTLVNSYEFGGYVINGIPVITIPAKELKGFLPHTSLAVAGRIFGFKVERGVVQKHKQGDYAHLRAKLAKDFLGTKDSFPQAMLIEIVRLIAPRKILADNYRAILYSHKAVTQLGIPAHSIVRDNRFHCARDNQSVVVRGVACKTCDFACASEDEPTRADTQRALLGESLSYRTEVLAAFSEVHVTSGYLHRSVSQQLPGKKISIIPNPADDEEFVKACAAHVPEIPGINILVVGMLNENKGQFPFVQKLTRWLQKHRDAVVHLAGEGERIQKQIAEHAKSAGLDKQIVFHGFLGREPLYKLMKQCQIVALPTVWPEPFGRVPLEAGLLRKPVVAFAVGGLTESIRHDETGFLVAAGDYAAFQKGLEALAVDPELRWRMGEQGHTHIRKQFSVDRNVASMRVEVLKEPATATA